MNILTARSLLVILALAGGCFAQSEVGGASLNGTVTDPSGASVPNAKVGVSNAATGLARSTQTSDVGLYTFSGLPVGSYDLTIDAPGFKTVKRTGLPLQVGAVATVDVRLEVGSEQETVSVAADAPVVETTRSSAASNVTEQTVANLPVNGRNFIDFTLLTPGVVRDVRGTGDLSFAGQRGTENSLLVDGADSNNLFFGEGTGRTGFRPYAFSEDAVQEFQVRRRRYQRSHQVRNESSAWQCVRVLSGPGIERQYLHQQSRRGTQGAVSLQPVRRYFRRPYSKRQAVLLLQLRRSAEYQQPVSRSEYSADRSRARCVAAVSHALRRGPRQQRVSGQSRLEHRPE
jgi:hypothetical protein